jgi:hypothetical protein
MGLSAVLTPETPGVLLSPLMTVRYRLTLIFIPIGLDPCDVCPLCGQCDCYADEVSALLTRLSRTFIQSCNCLEPLAQNSTQDLLCEDLS